MARHAFSLTRLVPETSSRYGRPLCSPVNTSDFTICPTVTPHAAAASSAVRVDSAISRTAIASPSACAASATFFALAGSSVIVSSISAASTR
jgi:hypothetical protein